MKKDPCLFPLPFFKLLTGIACNTSYQSQSIASQSYGVIDYLQKDAETKPYTIFKKGKLRVSGFRIDSKGKGLIPDNLFGVTKYLELISISNQVMGFGGIVLNGLDFEFSKFLGKKLSKNHNISVSQKSTG